MAKYEVGSDALTRNVLSEAWRQGAAMSRRPLYSEEINSIAEQRGRTFGGTVPPVAGPIQVRDRVGDVMRAATRGWRHSNVDRFNVERRARFEPLLSKSQFTNTWA